MTATSLPPPDVSLFCGIVVEAGLSNLQAWTEVPSLQAPTHPAKHIDLLRAPACDAELRMQRRYCTSKAITSRPARLHCATRVLGPQDPDP